MRKFLRAGIASEYSLLMMPVLRGYCRARIHQYSLSESE